MPRPRLQNSQGCIANTTHQPAVQDDHLGSIIISLNQKTVKFATTYFNDASW